MVLLIDFFFFIQSERWYLNSGLKSQTVWTQRAVLHVAPVLCRSLYVLRRSVQLPECGKVLSLCHSVFEGGSRWL